jgi:hypothetical protein
MAYLCVPMLGIGIADCTVGPNYQSPEIAEAPRRTSPETAGMPCRTVEGEIDQTWWKTFRDPQLSSLVERLVAQNLDLKTVAERVVQSVAQRQVAVSQGLPHLEGQSSSTYNRQSQNGTLSLLVQLLANCRCAAAPSASTRVTSASCRPSSGFVSASAMCRRSMPCSPACRCVTTSPSVCCRARTVARLTACLALSQAR